MSCSLMMRCDVSSYLISEKRREWPLRTFTVTVKLWIILVLRCVLFKAVHFHFSTKMSIALPYWWGQHTVFPLKKTRPIKTIKGNLVELALLLPAISGRNYRSDNKAYVLLAISASFASLGWTTSSSHHPPSASIFLAIFFLSLYLHSVCPDRPYKLSYVFFFGFQPAVCFWALKYKQQLYWQALCFRL